jgi:type II secretory pathway component PulF
MPKELKKEDLIRFNKELLAVVKAGVPLERGLAQMVKELSGPLRDFAGEIEHRAVRGESLADALEAHRPRLSEYYISLLRAGEETGNLAAVLETVVLHYQRSLAFERTIKSAIRYPLVVICLAFIIFVVFTRVLMPRMQGMFATLGAPVPFLSRTVFSIGYLVNAHLLLILVCIVALVILVRLWARTPSGKRFWDAVLFSLPFIGKAIYFDFVSRFTRSLGHLLHYKVPLDRALVLARSTLWHSYGVRVTQHVEDAVRKGISFSDALERERCFPETMVWTIKFAEERGDLESTLRDIADYYDDRYFELRTEVTQYFEPVLILFVGAVIGFLVISFYLPLFELPRYIRD